MGDTPLPPPSAHINHHHIGRFHGFVGNAAGLITTSPRSRSIALTLPQVKSPARSAAAPCWLQIPAVLALHYAASTMPAFAMRAFTQSRLSPLLPPGLPPFRSTSQSGTPAIATLFERFETTFEIHHASPNGTFLKTPDLVSFTCTATYARFRPATPSARRCPTPRGCDIRVELEPRVVEIVRVAQRLLMEFING